MSNIRETLTNAMKQAMIDKDSQRLTVIRMINAKIKDADIAGRTKGLEYGIVKAEILSLLQNMIKQRTESAKMYIDGNRPELAKVENNEILVITEFLPKQMSEAEVKSVVDSVIKETGASAMSDMGKVMKQIKSKYAGKLDMGLASKIIRNSLA